VEVVHRDCAHPADPYVACAHCDEPLDARAIDARGRPVGPAVRLLLIARRRSLRYRVSVVVIDAAGNRSAPCGGSCRSASGPADRRLIRPPAGDGRDGAAPRQRNPFRMISRSARRRVALDVLVDDPGAPLLDLAAARQLRLHAARIHGISCSCANQAMRPLKSVTRSPS
jgi:hypothetical protein